MRKRVQRVGHARRQLACELLLLQCLLGSIKPDSFCLNICFDMLATFGCLLSVPWMFKSPSMCFWLLAVKLAMQWRLSSWWSLERKRSDFSLLIFTVFLIYTQQYCFHPQFNLGERENNLSHLGGILNIWNSLGNKDKLNKRKNLIEA